MRDTYGNTNKTLVALAEQAFGLRYDSPEAKKILDREDWAQHWPVVDADGLLTGDVVETDDCKNYLNVDDLAMVHKDDLRPAQRTNIDSDGGYANLDASDSKIQDEV